MCAVAVIPYIYIFVYGMKLCVDAILSLDNSYGTFTSKKGVECEKKHQVQLREKK